MSETFEKKCGEMKKIFASLPPAQRYETLIQMGRALPPLSPALKTPDRLVSGCQSTLYLSTTLQDGNLFFEASADALISAGLAALLIAIYSGESPFTVLKCPPHFIEELGLSASLSPNRSSGLAHIYLKMKQDALKYLIKIDSIPARQ